MGEEEGKKVKLDEYGQLAIGYDLAKARAWALDDARQNLPARYPWLHGLELTWEITSARFLEDQDAYEVVVTVYPQEVPYRQKAEWVYHIGVRGDLMPGTPWLRASLELRPQERPEPGDFPLPGWPRWGSRRRRGGWC